MQVPYRRWAGMLMVGAVLLLVSCGQRAAVSATWPQKGSVEEEEKEEKEPPRLVILDTMWNGGFTLVLICDTAEGTLLYVNSAGGIAAHRNPGCWKR